MQINSWIQPNAEIQITATGNNRERMREQHVIAVESPDDPRLSMFANMRHNDLAKGGRYFIAEGHLIVQRLLESRFQVASVLIQEGMVKSYLDLVPESVAIYTLPRRKMAELLGFDFHRGVLACGIREPLHTVDDFLSQRPLPNLTLALMGVSELENVGSILRSAAALGVNHILLDDGTVDPLRRRVIRVSMATAFKHRFYRLEWPEQDLRRIAIGTGAQTIATTLDREATVLDESRFIADPKVLMIGNEAIGLDPVLQRIATERLTIPMQLGTDSLNVAVASAIMMYVLTRSN
ncbi:putative TrmH family tRNA/rRNA methyltransferase [Planctomycetes bacterium CA13]|uniref:Putative TrmH family tRNA/rRNA methyltransferase n=1 Tax=Novipirellula herctigrandis TaxID=2527986 RepID=A0A5C5YMR4_9BACT|nr:putative TrmH family tRNA/rRNA methyltransferase [Planctomycetes bacterium CA13]